MHISFYRNSTLTSPRYIVTLELTLTLAFQSEPMTLMHLKCKKYDEKKV